MQYLRLIQLSCLTLLGWGIWVLGLTPFKIFIATEGSQASRAQIIFGGLIITTGVLSTILSRNYKRDERWPGYASVLAGVGWFCINLLFLIPFLQSTARVVLDLASSAAPTINDARFSGPSTGIYMYSIMSLQCLYAAHMYLKEVALYIHIAQGTHITSTDVKPETTQKDTLDV